MAERERHASGSVSPRTRIHTRLARRARAKLDGSLAKSQFVASIQEELRKWIAAFAPTDASAVERNVVAAVTQPSAAAAPAVVVDEAAERARRAALDTLVSGDDSGALERLIRLELGDELEHFAHIAGSSSQRPTATFISQVAQAAVDAAAGGAVRETRFVAAVATVARAALVERRQASARLPASEESPWTALSDAQRDVCSLAVACRLSTSEVSYATGRPVAVVKSLLTEACDQLDSSARPQNASRAAVDAAIAISLCAGRQHDALAFAIDRYGPGMRGYLRACAGSESHGDDLSQEVWTVAASQLPSVLPRSTYAWLYGVGRHALMKLLSRYSRRKRVSLDTGSAANLVAPTHSSDARREGRRRRVAAALGSLSPTERSVVLLRVDRDLSYADIAVILGTTEGAARVRMDKAKRKLRAALHEPS